MIEKRQPIVTVLGHVDHGKTTLLDNLRKTKIVDREAGGITQSIGASIVQTEGGQKITFIDTPGHAAFSGMRSRGAKVADIAVLVVAADDGVKPQTKEAIGFIQEANIPFIVALTKTDLPSANVQNALATLETEGIYFEGRGGNTPYVEVSARQNVGVDKLLELIVLVSDINDILADADAPLEAVVIETGKDQRGALATVVVRNGKLEVGKLINAAGQEAKVRGLFDHQNKSVKKINPGEPALILGFDAVPQIGVVIEDAGKDKKVNAFVEQRVVTKGKMLEGQLPLVLKTQNAGALEALLASIPEGVFVVSASVGDINENDIFLARTSGAKIFAFEVKVNNQIAKLAETEKVEVKSFKIIYDLTDRINELIKAGTKVIVAKMVVIATFPFNNKIVAGCRLELGQVSKGNKLILVRDEKDVAEVRVTSVRRGKDELTTVTEGEFGAILEPQLDFTIGDVLISRA
ncbi:MAG: translation initiation factor IF-2 [Patescibacteria group bacterium]